MSIVKCAKGHRYDNSITPTCPQCAAASKSSGLFEDYGPTEAADLTVEGGGWTDIGPTEAAETTMETEQNQFVTKPDKTIHPDQGFDVMPPTEVWPPVKPGTDKNPPARPVVGWLVCIEGADRGRDYPIHDGYNTIGRGPSNDIAIQNDIHISREKHALIAYDHRKRVFFYGPAEGRNIVYLNDEALTSAVKIKEYDVIDFETTKLVFVPFCGERFNWDE